jgi:very-short-patch-repair endonuclease
LFAFGRIATNNEQRTKDRKLSALVKNQHGVISRRQLLQAGFSSETIQRRMAAGRLHPVHRGVYAVGRSDLGRYGEFMAAVLACGPRAVLSHTAAGELWGMVTRTAKIHATSPSLVRVTGVATHRRLLQPREITRRHNIPVTRPLLTLIDMATQLTQPQLESAISEADAQGLIHATELPSLLAGSPRRPGLAALKAVATTWFRRTDSDLERRLLQIIRNAGLPIPLTQHWVNGHRVDFYWPELGLVVETDGLTYHRTSASQLADRRRDQAHEIAGLTQLRFSNSQVRHEAADVTHALATVIARLEQAAA